MKIDHKILGWAFVFGIGACLIHVILGYLVFNEGETFLSMLWPGSNLELITDRILIMLSYAIFGLFMGRVYVERYKAYQELEAVNQQLQASVQELQASNQQLRARNQQLQAAEEELRAAYEQLETSHQQLEASHRQLKDQKAHLESVNQQLDAANQQLEAANQQLKANEAQLESVNQQLAESNQQLASSNQQLEAANQQLASSNQQLEAANQQLEAANRHLHESESKIRQQNVFLNSVIESLGHPFYVIDAADYRIRLANSAAHALGLSTSSIYDLLRPKQDPGAHEARVIGVTGQVLKTKRPAFGESAYAGMDGRLRYFEIHGYPIFNEQGDVEQIIEYSIDITERKQAEEALKESQERYYDLYDHAPDSFLSVDAQTARIIQCNQTLVDMTGYRKEELIGRSVFDLYHPDCRDEVKKVFKTLAVTGKVTNQEFVIQRKDGAAIDVMLNASAVRDEQGRLLHSRSIWRDISQRKEAERQLQALSRRQQAILASVPDIIMEVDADKVYTWTNPAGYEFFGEDVLGHEAADYFEGEQRTYNNVRPLFKGDENVIYVEGWQRRKDGEKRLLAWWCRVLKDQQGHVTGALSTARDITGQKQTELLMQEWKNRYETAVRASGHLLYDWNSATNEVVYGGDIERILGYTPAEMEGGLSRWQELIHPEDQDHFKSVIEQLIANGAAANLEYRVRKKDGSYIYVEDEGNFIVDAEEQTKQMIGFVKDITDKKKVEEALRRSDDIVRAIPSGLFIYQYEAPDKLILLDGNPAAELLTGITVNNWIGKEFNEIWPPAAESGISQNFLNVMHSGKPYETEDISYKDNRLEGAFKMVVFVMGEDRLGVAFEDITERKQAEDLQRIQHKLALELNGIRTLETGLQICLEAALSTSRMDGGGIYLMDEKTGALELVYQKGLPGDFVDRVSYLPAETDNVKLVLQGKPVYTQYDNLGVPLDEVQLAAKLKAIAVLPIHHEGRVIGCLNVTSFTLDEVPAFSRDALETITAQIGNAISRLRAEAALRESEQFLDSIFESIQDGISVLAPDMTVSHVNGVVKKWYAANLPLEGKKCYEVYHNKDKPCDPCPTVRCLKTGKTEREIVPGLSGSEAEWIELYSYPMKDAATGAITGVVEFVRDITPRRQMEIALKESEARYRALFDGAPDAVFLADAETGRIIDANRTACQMMLKSHDEIVGRHHSQLHPPEADDYSRKAFHKQISQLQNRQQVQPIENQVLRSDGTTAPVEVMAQMINIHGRPVIQGVFRDISERLHVEEMRKESEQKYRMLFEHAMDGIFTMKVVDDKPYITDCNSQAVRMFGRRADEIVGQSPADFSPLVQPDGAGSEARVKEIAELAMSGRPCYFDWTHCRRDGACFDTEVTVNRVDIGPANYLLAIVRDITQRKQAQRALAESEAKFRNIYEQSPQAVEIFDAQGYFQDVNPAGLDLFGVSDVIELKGLNLFDNPNIPEEILEKLRQGKEVRYEVPFDFDKVRQLNLYPTYKTGRYYLNVWITPLRQAESESPTGYMAKYIDINASKEAEQALREREATMKTILQAAPIGIGQVTNRQLGWTNEQVSKMTGYSRQELWGQNARMLYDTDEEYERVGRIKYPQIEKTGVGSLETRWRRKDGGIFDILLSSAALDPGNLSAGLIFTALDITQRKQAEAEAQQRRNELAHAARLSTIGEMASGLAHELNQPLTAISAFAAGCLRMLKPAAPVTEEVLAAMQNVAAQATRAGEIIHRIRNFTRKQELQRKDADIHRILTEGTSLIEADLRQKKVKVQLDLGADVPPVPVDAIQIEQVALNLMRNGIEAMDDPSITDRRLHIKTRLTDRRDQVEVSIQDNGVGIDPDKTEKIFDSFFTTKDWGLGLGLSLSRSIIESHGGYLWAVSNPHGGATFKFTLPLRINHAR